MTRFLALMLALVVPLGSSTAEAPVANHPEARAFTEGADSRRDLHTALAAAAVDGRRVIVVMGANWCHDSRALAGWFASPRFEEMLGRQYHVVYVDAGTPQTGNGRNLDIAKRFGIKKVKNTPLVMILSGDGTLLNSRKDAARWRNASSRSEDDIYRYFAAFTPA